jgi:C1A family cysteine protease
MAKDEEVAALKQHLQDSGAKWRAGKTALSELSAAEAKKRLGWAPPKGEPTLQERERDAKAKHAKHAAESPSADDPAPSSPSNPASVSTADPAPPTATADAATATATATVAAPAASFDLRQVSGSGYITPVKDQGNCGSCVAFGSTAAVEGTLRWQTRDPNLAVDLSEAQLFYCIAIAQQGRTCAAGQPNSGWWRSGGLDAYRDIGIADDACFPYVSGNTACSPCANAQSRLTKITGWHYLNTAADMKTWLSTRGPLVTGFTVYDDFMHYTGGVYSPTSSTSLGGHCVCAVGYDDINQCWICKNSWGTGWGEGGFFRIGYGQCGIDYNMLAVDGVISKNFKSSYVPPGKYLGVGDFVASSNRKYFAIMQGDGNFVLYHGSDPSNQGPPFWASNTYGQGQCFAIMQSDGNFVVYKGSDPAHQGAFVWNSGRAPGQNQYFAVMQNDANFVVYQGSDPAHPGAFVWNSGTQNGKVTVNNQGGYVARCSIEYTLGGQRLSQASGNFPIAQSYSLDIPVGASNVHVKCEDATGLIWEPWKTILDKTYTNPPTTPPRVTFTLTGTTLSPSYSER